MELNPKPNKDNKKNISRDSSQDVTISRINLPRKKEKNNMFVKESLKNY